MPASSEKDVCLSPHKYGDTCTFRCEAGYHLPPDALYATQCTVEILPGGATPLMQWHVQPEPCIGRVLFCRYIVFDVFTPSFNPCQIHHVSRCNTQPAAWTGLCSTLHRELKWDLFRSRSKSVRIMTGAYCWRCYLFSAHALNSSHIIKIRVNHFRPQSDMFSEHRTHVFCVHDYVTNYSESYNIIHM